MKNLRIRAADHTEFDQIYLMGFDVWAEGSEAEYLAECRGSPKYARGKWYVLENEECQLISSLIVYGLGQNQYGIGSIATPRDLRRKGYASALISAVIRQIESMNSEATIFLYSDIEPEFYERFNFVRVSSSAQRYKTKTCMVRGKGVDKVLDKTMTPEYF